MTTHNQPAHNHAAPKLRLPPHAKKLLWVFALVITFLVVEVIASLITNSLALLSDAGHMLTDAISILIAVIAAVWAIKPADHARTYGYQRIEVLAPIFNCLLLLAMAVYIFVSAIYRFNNPQSIHAQGMLIVATVGLLVNFISLYILRSPNNPNMRAVYLEVMADMLSSLGVIIAAIGVWLWGLTWMDTAVAIAIALWVLPRTLLLLRENIHILLEGVPVHLDLQAIEHTLRSIDGVADLHDLHVWGLTPQQIALTVHLVVPSADNQTVLETASELLADEFGIHHTTIQCERIVCGQSRAEHEQYASHQQS